MSLAAVIEASGGRRFVLSVGAAAMTTLLQALGKLDPAGSTYALVVLGTVGAYITGNTVQKNFEARAEATPTAAPATSSKPPGEDHNE